MFSVIQLLTMLLLLLLLTFYSDDPKSQFMEVKRPELEIFQDQTKDIAISNATKEPVSTVKEALLVLAKAWRNRSVGRTDMNEHSSRSHCLILLSIGEEMLLTAELLVSTVWRVVRPPSRA